MPIPDHSNGAPCWIDLMTSAPDKARSFYGGLFGWTFITGSQEEYGGYITASKNGKPVAGIMQKMENQTAMPDMWSTYLRCDDAAAITAAITANGGQVYVGPMEVPGQGHMAICGDPSGAVVGVWQPGGHQGYGLRAEPGAPVWHELHTKDYDKAVKFYQDVFGWNTNVLGDDPGFRYVTLGAGDTARAGILDASDFLPDGVPSSWQVYFGVENADAAVATAVELGGTVVQSPENSPFGRNATLSDPTGAIFMINQELPHAGGDAL